MAGAKSIDDIFSSEVDEKEVNALIGSLETKLAPANPKARSGLQQDSVVTKNHVNDNASLHPQPGPGGLAALQGDPGVSVHANAARPTAQELHLGNSKGNHANHETKTSVVHRIKGGTQGNGQNNHGVSTAGAKTVKPGGHALVISNMTKPPNATSVPVAQQSPAIVAQIQAQGIGLGSAKLNDPSSNIAPGSTLNKDAMNQLRTSANNGDQQIMKVVSVPGAVTTSTSGAGLSLNEGGANLNSATANNTSTAGGTAKEQLLIRQQTVLSNDPSGAIKPRIIVQPSVATVQQTPTATAAMPVSLPPGSVTVGNPSQKVVTINVANPGLSGAGRPGQYVVNTVPGTPKGGAVSPQVVTQTVRMPGAGAHQVIAPARTQLGGQVQIRLPPGTTLPPGVVLINKGGTVQAVMAGNPAIQMNQAHVAGSPGLAYRPVQPGTQIVTSTSQPGRIFSSASGGATAIVNSPQIVANTSRAGSPVVIASSPAAVRGPTGANSPISMHQVTPGKSPAAPSKGSGSGGGANTGGLSNAAMDNVKKCKNFLTTLIKLASNANQPPHTVQNVKTLVQNLIDAKIEPEEFTLKLQKELNSSPQPYLVPFLKRSLPLLRQTLLRGTAGSNINSLMGPLPPPSTATSSAPPVNSSSSATTTSTADVKPSKASKSSSSSHSASAPSASKSEEGKGSSSSSKSQSSSKSSKSSKSSSPGRSPSPSTKSSSSKSKSSSQSSSKSSKSKSGSSKSGSKSTPSRKEKNKADTAAAFSSSRDDDDINDVASMAGVNLSEESARILATNEAFVGTQLRSCEDQKFLHLGPLQHRMSKICTKHGIKDATPAALNVVSLAVQERLKQVVEKLSVVSQHRLEIYRNDPRYEANNDVRSQLKFFEQLDALERKRRDEQEREMLLRAAKSRSKQEDPEQLRLKQKAKEMQQMELEQLRQQEANLTALAAIGPRKKRKLDSDTAASSPGGAGGSSSLLSTLSSPGSNTTPFLRTTFRRTKRVNMKDLLYLLEQEPDTRKSRLLYRMYLK